MQKNAPDQTFTELVRHFLDPKEFYDVLEGNGVSTVQHWHHNCDGALCMFVQHAVRHVKLIVTSSIGIASRHVILSCKHHEQIGHNACWPSSGSPEEKMSEVDVSSRSLAYENNCQHLPFARSIISFC